MASVLQVAGVAALWFVLFSLNDWAFGYLDQAHVISWVFLPAALRLLGVLLFGRWAALGLFLGALATNGTAFGHSMAQSVSVAALSGLGALGALHLTTRILQVPPTLRGLTAGRLAVFAVVGALCNVIPHNLFFWAVGLQPNPFVGLVPMFIGDLAGIVIVLYGLRGVLLLIERRMRVRTP
ncbi:hypothetical protein WKW79_23015 [Variovorax robiniae]|uniref:Uncharacterized protein n=1 Tax=Variovorax robiniae TaxID=1836199 RepID=A0ABU8XC96_9BURK